MNKEFKKEFAALTVFAAVTGIGLYYLYRLERKSNKELAAIEKDCAAQIDAIQKAGANISKKIQDGYYNDKPWQAVLTDYEFAKIAYLNK